jgi:hypothetical protein
VLTFEVYVVAARFHYSEQQASSGPGYSHTPAFFTFGGKGAVCLMRQASSGSIMLISGKRVNPHTGKAAIEEGGERAQPTPERSGDHDDPGCSGLEYRSDGDQGVRWA